MLSLVSDMFASFAPLLNAGFIWYRKKILWRLSKLCQIKRC